MMKIFTVAVVMTIVATLTVASEKTDAELDKVDMEDSPTIRSLCPPNATANFDVIYNGDYSSTVGCAFLEYGAPHEFTDLKAFSVRFGRWINSGPRVCVPGKYAGMELLTFSCTSRSASKPEQFDSGKGYKIYGYVFEPATVKHYTRCVLYKMTESVLNAMAISKSKSCKGLSRTISLSKAVEGSTLLWLNRPNYYERRRRSTLEDKNSTQLNFSGSRFFWRTG